MDNKECYIFRDLYNSYLEEELEEETVAFIKDHLETCIECKKWVSNYTSGKEQKDYDDHDNSLEKESSFKNKEDEKTIKKLKIIMIIGICIVAFLAIWMSIWMYI